MVKALKWVLGALAGDNKRTGFGVIGRVELSQSGNTIIETGVMNDDKSWTETEKGGHLVLRPEEREELIGVLESHRMAPRYEVGDKIGGHLNAVIISVQYHEGLGGERPTGTVLAYADHKGEYWVWSLDAMGVPGNGTYSYDLETALNKYTVRLAENLYSHFNRRPPALTFSYVADRDRVKG